MSKIIKISVNAQINKKFPTSPNLPSFWYLQLYSLFPFHSALKNNNVVDTFEVEESVATELQTIKNMIEDNYIDSVIPLHNVTSDILELVIKDCKKHAE